MNISKFNEGSLSLSLDNEWITKKFESELFFRIELERTREAINLAKHTSFFIVPSIKSVEENAITFKYFQPSVTVADLLDNDIEEAIKMIPKIAKTLLYLQKNLNHSDKKVLASKGLETSGSKSFVHGDFTVHNILFQDRQVVLIDWSSSRWIDHPFNFANVHWDLIWFIQSVFLMSETRSFKKNNKEYFCKSLLESYLSELQTFSKAEIAKYALQVNSFFYKNIFLTRNKWYQIIKHKHKWRANKTFWKDCK